MRRILCALVVASSCQAALGQQATTSPQPAGQTKAISAGDSSTEAEWITHRRAGQLQWLDPANWEIRGCQSFSAHSIRAALAIDIDVTLATHPSAPADHLETLPALLRDKIVAGYQSLGFYRPQVNVQHSRDDKKVLVDIVEGHRYLCGAIEIAGTHELNREQIVAQLMQVQSGASLVSSNGESGGTTSPIWKTGEPAGFSTIDLVKLRKKVQRMLADLGRPAAKFDVKVEPNGTTARLNLQISDEGPATKIDHITVSGNLRNTQQQILDYLAIKTGTVWTRDEKSRIEKLLLDSARFREFKIDYAASDKGVGTVAVSVVESKSTPELGQSLTPVEQALLKFGKWASTFDQSAEDLVCTIVEGKFNLEAVFSPQQGCVVTARRANDEQPQAVPAPRSAVLSTDFVGLFSEVRGHQWVAPLLPGYVGSTYEFRISADGDETRTNFIVGLGVRSTVANSGKRPAVQVNVKATPSALVSLAHQDDAHCSLAGDVLTVEFAKTADRETSRIKIDAKTGKLLECVVHDALGGETKLSLAAGVYGQRIKTLQATWGRKPNDFSNKQPLTSLLGFLLDEARSSDFEKLELVPPLAINAVRKTISQGLVEPFDQYLLQSATKFAPPLFSIPYDYDSRPQFVSALGKFAFVSWILGNDIAARDTWPWVLTREATAWLTGLDEYQQLELAEQLELPGNGPLCCLVTAEVLLLAGQNEAARQFAMLGLAQLTPEKFHADVADLLDERGLLGRCLLRCAEVLRETDSLTIAFIGFDWPEEPQHLLTHVYIELTKDRRPIDQALPEVLDRLWETSVKSILETALKAVKERAAGAPSQLAKPGDAAKVPTTARGTTGAGETKK